MSSDDNHTPSSDSQYDDAIYRNVDLLLWGMNQEKIDHAQAELALGNLSGGLVAGSGGKDLIAMAMLADFYLYHEMMLAWDKLDKFAARANAVNYLKEHQEHNPRCAALICSLYSHPGDKLDGLLDSNDAATSKQFCQVAAEKGDPNASCALGILYFRGKGVAQDNEKAQQYLRAAAKEGHALAQYTLAKVYIAIHGLGMALVKMRPPIESAANQGLKTAQFEAGKIYLYGWGIADKDPATARGYFEMAAH